MAEIRTSSSFFRSFRLALLTMSRADRLMRLSATSRPFSRRVAPVSTMSTMPSESPSSGASSTEPSILMISTSMPFPAKKLRATPGYLVATVLTE